MSVSDAPAHDGSFLGTVLRPFESTSIGPAWIGLGMSVAYLLLHAVFDAAFLALGSFSPGTSPIWRNELWWTDCVNATMIGYFPAP